MNENTNELEQRLNQETQLRIDMQRKHEEELARLEMHKRLQTEELEHRTRMQQNFMPQAQPVVIHNVIQNNVNMTRPTLGVVIRALYFCFFGWYVGFAWIAAALVVCCTIIGIPLGILMLAKTSQAFFLW